jgi:hypothetical protein
MYATHSTAVASDVQGYTNSDQTDAAELQNIMSKV